MQTDQQEALTPRGEQAPNTPPTPPMPTVGRVVHFYPAQHPSETVAKPAAAAVVTYVYTPGGRMVELYVLPGSWNGSPHYETSIPHADDAAPGAAFWSWPPRV